MKSRFSYLVTLWGFILLVMVPKAKADPQLPALIGGTLDLRAFNFHEKGSLPLQGDWKFQPGLIQDWKPGDGARIAVPGSWTGIVSNGITMPAQGTGTYFLTVLLPAETPPLSFYFPEISTAFELRVNGQVLGKAGKVGPKGEAVPLYQPQVINLADAADSLQLMIQVANFHHWRGGIMHTPILGSQVAIGRIHTIKTLEGGVLASIFAVLGVIFLGFFAYRPKAKYHLWFAVASFLCSLNVMQLTHRWGYLILGESGWQMSFRLEYLLLIGLVAALTFMLSTFYPDMISAKAQNRVLIVCGLEVVFILVMPFPWVTYMEFLALVDYLIVMSGIFPLIKAYRQGREASLLFLILLGASMLPWILAGTVLGEPVGEIQPLHYGLALIFLSISLILVRRSGNAFSAVEVLSKDLDKTNQNLEKANYALAERNQTLEDEVKKRTEQLVAIEKKAHELELEGKNRDMETLGANNLMKLKLKRNLIQELEKLQENPKDLEREIKLMTFDLKRQVATEEKIGVLQKDMAKVNSEFYSRLQKRYPKLNKTERELCAYINLNLSSQEIADLRNTTLNSINVTRYRLRKKLGIDRGTELQAFIQQI